MDTDVLIDALRGRDQATGLVARHAERLIVPAVVCAELYAGVRGEQDLRRLDAFLAALQVQPTTREIARAGGLYMKTFAASHGVGFADALIAATADVLRCQLLTLNIRHFPMFPTLQPAYRKL